MSNALNRFLQPERREDETLEKYVERRNSAGQYVQSSLMGTLFWNTDLQGNYFNEARKNRPRGKSGHRIAKKLARMARERGLHLTLDQGAPEPVGVGGEPDQSTTVQA